MSQYGQTQFKNLAANASDYFGTLCIKDLTRADIMLKHTFKCQCRQTHDPKSQHYCYYFADKPSRNNSHHYHYNKKLSCLRLMRTIHTYTAQNMKFFIKDFFSKCNHIRSFMRIWSHLLKKSLMENFMSCAVLIYITY